MRTLLLLAAAALLLAAPVHAFEPRQEGPVIDIMKELGMKTLSPEELRRAIAEAEAYPFGSSNNPVRVSGPPGERAYLARLRCADGSPPTIGMRGSVGAGPYGTLLDAYPVSCGEAGPPATEIFMDMYFNDETENRAPPGFSITPQ